MTYYWLYGRLGVHVAATDDELMSALDEYADGAIKGGAGALTDEHRDGIRREHAAAYALYAGVTRGAWAA